MSHIHTYKLLILGGKHSRADCAFNSSQYGREKEQETMSYVI